MSSWITEEAHKAQSAYVRRSVVRRVAHDTAFYALFESGLLAKHSFDSDSTAVGSLNSDLVVNEEYYEPNEKQSWSELRGVKGWSPKLAWHSPAAEHMNDTVADVLVAAKVPDLTPLNNIVRLTPPFWRPGFDCEGHR